MTTARYYTPSGRSIQALGITPDVVVEAAKVMPVGARSGGHQAGAKPEDYQLTRALDIVRGAAMFAAPSQAASQQAELVR